MTLPQPNPAHSYGLVPRRDRFGVGQALALLVDRSNGKSEGELPVTDERISPNGSNWSVVAETIRSRRSNLNVDLERPVPRELVEELIDLALLGPCLVRHRYSPARVSGGGT